MSNDIRKAFVVRLKDIGVTAASDSMFVDECLELVNAEVASVLETLEMHCTTHLTYPEGLPIKAVKLKTIQALKQRYGGE